MWSRVPSVAGRSQPLLIGVQSVGSPPSFGGLEGKAAHVGSHQVMGSALALFRAERPFRIYSLLEAL